MSGIHSRGKNSVKFIVKTTAWSPSTALWPIFCYLSCRICSAEYLLEFKWFSFVMFWRTWKTTTTKRRLTQRFLLVLPSCIHVRAEMNSSQLFPDVNSAICDVLLDSNWSWISGIKYKIEINSVNKNNIANLKLNLTLGLISTGYQIDP